MQRFRTPPIASDTIFNEFRFQFARRSNYFGFSNLPGGSDLGVNIPGYAYFGREPYSTVNRVEKRFQFTDNVTWTKGRHTFKFGADTNIILLRPSGGQQIFELDFGGVANFGPLPASSFGLPDCISLTTGPHNGACSSGELVVPGATPLQAYGLGVPTTYIQGIGTSNTPFDNIPFGFFAQDSWKITPKITLNYGVRYDVEITPAVRAGHFGERGSGKGAGRNGRHSPRLQECGSAHRTCLGPTRQWQDGGARQLWAVLRSSAAGHCV